MKKRLIFLCFTVAILALSGRAEKASANPPGGADQSHADAEWDDLSGFGQVLTVAGADEANDAVSLKTALSRHARNLVSKAERVQEFLARHPQHPKAAEAKRLEALLLLQAVQAGDTSVVAEMNAVVESLRVNLDVPEPVRAEIAGLADFFHAGQMYGNAPDLPQAFEAVARGLIAEFPFQPQGYESLLTIALEADEAKGRSLAGELINMGTPAAVIAGAEFMLKRYDLVGQALVDLLADDAARQARNEIKPDSPTIIYTWASWSPESIQLAGFLAARNLSGVTVLALNLDANAAVAREYAQLHALPGVQIYDAESVVGSLARRLGVNGAPYVYLIDARGIIRDVRAAQNLPQKLSQLGL